MIAWWFSVAQGAPVTATYCFRYENLDEFIDHHVGVGSNFTSFFEKARGVKIEFAPQGGGNSTTAYALNGPSNDGCATVTLDNAIRYDIFVHLEAQRANGTLVRAVEKDGNNWVVKRYLMSSALGHVPANGQSYGPSGWAQSLSGNNSLVRLHAAANHATLRWDLGIAGGVVELEADPMSMLCGSSSLTCYDIAANRIHVSPNTGHNDSLEQARIAHEVGHAMWNHRNGDQGYLVNTAVEPDACGPKAGYDWNTKEWQSIAVIEALAWFYAATAFNDDDQNQCELFGSETLLDWNRSGNAYDLIDKIDCDGQIVAQNGNVLTNATNYYGQYCSAGPDANRGIELDWVRLLWKLRTVHGFERADFEVMVDGANPHSWVFAIRPGSRTPTSRTSA